MSNKKTRESLWNWFRAYNREPLDENKTSEPLNGVKPIISKPRRNVDRFADPHAAWRAYARSHSIIDLEYTLWQFIKWLFDKADNINNTNDKGEKQNG